MVLEKNLESPLNNKIKPINPKGNQPIPMNIRRTDAEAEIPILWPPDAKCQLIGKDPDSGKEWGQELKGETEDKMIRWHNQFNRHEFEETPEDSAGQGSLACCSPWGQIRLSDWTANLSLSEKRELSSVPIKVSKKKHFFLILWYTQSMIIFELHIGVKKNRLVFEVCCGIPKRHSS